MKRASPERVFLPTLAVLLGLLAFATGRGGCRRPAADASPEPASPLAAEAAPGRPLPPLRMAGEARRAEAEALGAPAAHERPTPRGWPRVVRFGGPVRTETAAELRAAGAAVAGYVPDDAIVAEIPDAALPAVRAIRGVVAVEEFRPAWKISPRLLERARAEPERPVGILVQTFAPEDEGRAAARLAALGATDLRPSRRAAPDARSHSRRGIVAATLPAGTVPALAAEPTVCWMEESFPKRLCNDVARGAANLAAEALQTLGLDGAGQIAAVMDTGLDSGDPGTLHPDVRGRVIKAFAYGRPDDWSDLHGHGTHVTGSLLGSGALSDGRYRGLAPAATLVMQSAAKDSTLALAIDDDLNPQLGDAYDAGARVHSDSWGGGYFGDYDIAAQTADEFVWDHPDLLMVAAAGNDGVDANRDGVIDALSVSSPSTAKNVLAVGASESGRAPGSGGYSSRTWKQVWRSDYPADPIASDLVSTPPAGNPPGLAAFSSRGPCSDGRVKPDVVAPGTDVVSIRSRRGSSVGWGVLGSNTNYTFSGGTSMSVPLAAGAAVLVRQWVQRRFALESPSAAALKAALCGGARSLAPGQYGTDAYREIPEVRPNNAEGHGLVDLAATLLPGGGSVAALHDGGAAEALATGGEARYAFEVDEPGLPLAVVLAYSDAPAFLGTGKALVNDLDLLLVAPGGETNAAPDRLNNVERIDLASAPTGRWEVVVSAHAVPIGPQPWTLYLRGAVRTDPAIAHEPLPDQPASAASYPVEATIRAEGRWDPATARLHWRVDGGAEQSAPMTAVDADDPLYPATTFRADLPAAPLGSTVEYRIAAGNAAAAPAAGAWWSFRVRPDATLSIAGDPATAGSSDPAYGTWSYASGVVVRVAAPAAIPDAADPDGLRTACLGWRGTGSAPAAGATNETAFAIAEDSTLVWRWQEQAALRVATAPAALAPERVLWTPLGAATSVVASASLADADGARLDFAGWTLDGARWPDASSPAPLAAGPIAMDAPRTLVARYLPAELDTDGDGLPDWFEERFFPAGGAGRDDDPDGDGWENAVEAADRTDPLDPGSEPEPPSVEVEPVPSPWTRLLPVHIRAAVADGGGIASARLHLRRNGRAERTYEMADEGGGVWGADTPATAADRDVFTYAVSALDAAGLESRTTNCTFEVRWPGLVQSGPAAILASATTNVLFSFANTGSIPLELSFALAPVGFADDMEGGPGGWTAASGTDRESLWHLGSVDFHSPSSAWSNARFDVSPAYRCGADDALAAPPVRVWPADGPGGEAPRLSLRHLADFEFDRIGADGTVFMWDAGVLETAAGDGDWTPLVPDGGYPAVRSDSPAALPAGTPCLANTDGWEPLAADLSALVPDAAAAADPLRFRFRFVSDLYSVCTGWRIDDVEIAPRTRSAAWASISTDAFSLAPGESAVFTLSADPATLGPMESDRLLLDIRQNDPRHPAVQTVPVAVANPARRLVVTSEGPGRATPAGETLYPGPVVATLGFVPDEGALLFDALLDGAPLPGAPIGAVAPAQAELPLDGNRAVHAVFLPRPPADAVPDAAWFAERGLTNRPAEVEALLDPDRDGLLTWQEARLGSDPLDAADAPLRVSILPPAPGETAWRLAWLAYTNLAGSYEILGATNLLETFEPLLPEPLPPSPPEMSAPLPSSDAPAAFYLLRYTRP